MPRAGVQRAPRRLDRRRDELGAGGDEGIGHRCRVRRPRRRRASAARPAGRPRPRRSSASAPGSRSRAWPDPASRIATRAPSGPLKASSSAKAEDVAEEAHGLVVVIGLDDEPHLEHAGRIGLHRSTIVSRAGTSSRTVRRALSRFGSSSAIDCHVPSAIRPPTTGTASDGEASSGRTWSAPWPGQPCACRHLASRGSSGRARRRRRPRCPRRARRRRAGGRVRHEHGEEAVLGADIRQEAGAVGR